MTRGPPAGDAPIEPRTGGFPFPRHRRARYQEGGRHLLFRKAAEVPKLDDLRVTRIEASQLLQRLIDDQQLAVAGLDCGEPVVETHSKGHGRALGGTMGPCMIDQDAAHHLRRDSEKMRAILPSDAL